MKPYIVTFAGLPGTSKSIVAQHLSYGFDLPVLSNDIIRSEVKEDLLVDDINIPEAKSLYEKRRDKRLTKLLQDHKSFVFDSSVDRKWGKLKAQLKELGYDYFLINMELSVEFLTKLYTKTGRGDFLEEVPDYLKQHQEFMNKYSEDIDLQINDKHFLNRLQLAETGLRSFLAN